MTQRKYKQLDGDARTQNVLGRTELIESRLLFSVQLFPCRLGGSQVTRCVSHVPGHQLIGTHFEWPDSNVSSPVSKFDSTRIIRSKP